MKRKLRPGEVKSFGQGPKVLVPGDPGSTLPVTHADTLFYMPAVYRLGLKAEHSLRMGTGRRCKSGRQNRDEVR